MRNAIAVLTFFCAPLALPARGAAQEQDVMILDGKPLSQLSAILDPFEGLRMTGSNAEGSLVVHFHYPYLEFPSASEHDLDRTDKVSITLVETGESRKIDQGQLVISAFARERVSGSLTWRLQPESKRRELEFSVPVRVERREPAVVKSVPEIGSFPMPARRPNPKDLVFCAVGDTGTGLPGAERVARSIARLARTGPLDFVLLLGDNFGPKGVESIRDPQWQSKFEKLFDPSKLAVPFYAVLGDGDHRSDRVAPRLYGLNNPRWTHPKPTYPFQTESHGAKFTFIGVDTTFLLGNISNPDVRIANRVMVHALQMLSSDWKIMFGHHSLYSSGGKRDGERSKKLREVCEGWFEKFALDLYIGGNDRSLEILKPKKGVTHVVSGGGGGPEMAHSLTCREDTIYGYTGGGFTWFRFDGEKLEITIYDADGRAKYVHYLKK